MPYSRVTRTKFGFAALEYVIHGDGHNGAEQRNEIETPINMCRKIAYHEQMEKYWSRASERHQTQIIRVIQSFSKNEFDPKNPEDIQKSNLVGQEFVREHYPNRQALVCTQIDGKGGCVHNHILINDVSMKDNKGCTNKQYHFESVRMWTDEITEKYTILDFGEGKQYANKFTEAEKTKRKKEEFCWKDELRKRISEAMESAVSEEDFIKKLADNDVEVKKRYRGKKDNFYLVYKLLDISKISERDRKRRVEFKARDRKLGIDYGLEALDAAIKINKAEKFSADKSTSSDDVDKKAYNDVKKIISDEKNNIIQQQTFSGEAEGGDYKSNWKKVSWNEETRAAVSHDVHEGSNENTKLNLSFQQINFYDILNDGKNEDKKDNVPLSESEHEMGVKKSSSSSAKAEEKRAEMAVISQPAQTPKENENAPAAVSQMLGNENDDEEVSEDNRDESTHEPEWSINIGRFGADYTVFSNSAEVQQKSDDEIGYS